MRKEENRNHTATSAPTPHFHSRADLGICRLPPPPPEPPPPKPPRPLRRSSSSAEGPRGLRPRSPSAGSGAAPVDCADPTGHRHRRYPRAIAPTDCSLSAHRWEGSAALPGARPPHAAITFVASANAFIGGARDCGGQTKMGGTALLIPICRGGHDRYRHPCQSRHRSDRRPHVAAISTIRHARDRARRHRDSPRTAASRLRGKLRAGLASPVPASPVSASR